ncbi:MAG: GNAT family N-acetyltransferase [Bacteroidaceae bacterium]|nr:GNAT family N-acetyltransferase [Bacteroidaceae bacterium]
MLPSTILRDIEKTAIQNGLFVMGLKDFPKLAETTARAFDGDPLFTHMKKDATFEQVRHHALVTFKTLVNHSIVLSCNDKCNDYIVVCEPGFKTIKTMSYILSGGLKTVFDYGIGGALRMINYESYATGMRKKFTGFNDLYLYQLATNPDFQSQGNGTRLLGFATRFARRMELPCYLETHTQKNVDYYCKRGFRLVAEEPLPGSDGVIHRSMICDK